MRIRYLADADLEMTAAAEYYEQQRPGLVLRSLTS
jgi:hypothetical protein